MNEMVFRTGGDWPSTTLHNKGREVKAAQLFVELRTARDDWNNPVRGGVYYAVAFTAIIRPQESPEYPRDILPGRLTMTFPGHEIVVENAHPMVELNATRVWYNGNEVTDRVVDVYVDVNAADDIVKAFLTLYQSRWLGADEAVTYVIVG